MLLSIVTCTKWDNQCSSWEKKNCFISSKPVLECGFHMGFKRGVVSYVKSTPYEHLEAGLFSSTGTHVPTILVNLPGPFCPNFVLPRKCCPPPHGLKSIVFVFLKGSLLRNTHNKCTSP